MKNLISISDLNKTEIFELVSLAKELKKKRSIRKDLNKKNILLLFEKPSLRTKLSFEIAIKELSGNFYYLGKEAGFGKREAIKDMAYVLSRYVDACIIRTFRQKNLIEFANYAKIPVINALTDLEHPCQVLSDLLTIKEKIGRLNNFKIAFIGDGNNVCHSLIQSAGILDFNLAIATPKSYEPKKEILKPILEKIKKNKIEILNKPKEAVKDADFIYTDVWTSMGWEKEKEKRKKIFRNFQINKKLLKNLNKKYYIMHCLPAHRGEEITGQVLDSKNSIVFEQAENRLHMHKAILVKLISSNF
jgi:ornithine carbamoyltransferase